jgi:TonB family protein
MKPSRALAVLSASIAFALGCAQPPPRVGGPSPLPASRPAPPPSLADRDPRERVTALYQAFLDAVQRKDVRGAITSGRSAVQAARATFGPKDRETAAMEINLGMVLVYDGAFENEAIGLLTGAIGNLSEAGVNLTPDLIEPYLALGRIATRKSDYPAARQHYYMATLALEPLQPEQSQRLVRTLLEASRVEDLDRKPGASSLLRERATALTRARAQQDPSTSALVLQQLARHALLRSDDAAEGLYFEALALLERAGTAEGKFAANLHAQLARLYEERGDQARAREQREIAARLRPGGGDLPVVRVEPEYPPRALGQKDEGAVMADLTLDAEGRVTDASVLDSDPPRVFDEAALKAVRQWVYAPSASDAKPTERRSVLVLLRFKPPR